METRKHSDDRPSQDTQPVSPFGTAPDLAVQLKTTDYDGTMLKDRYLIDGELGRGGIGVVYLARDLQLLQRRVVIKVLLQDSENSAHTPWFKKKFEQEIEALVRLDHPGIIGVLDAGVMPDGKLFFVMQYVPGETLRSLLKVDRIDFARIASIVRQIGAALSAAHDKGVIHRDLKPENIMVQYLTGGESLIKLIDFGIATVKDSQFSTSAERTKVAGALPYMAPEQLRGQPEPASDVWALGVIAYELVTGHLPFIADMMVQLHELQRQGLQIKPSQFRPDLPEAAERAILRSLSFDPSNRFAQAKDLGEELSRALTQSTSQSEQFAPGAQTISMTPERARDVFMKDTPSVTVPSAPTMLNPTDESLTGSSPSSQSSASSGILIAVFMIAILAALSAIIWWKLRPGSDNPPNTPSQQSTGLQGSQALAAPSMSLNYSLKVLAQGPNQKPAQIPSEIFFTPGDQLCIIFDSPQDGYLYVINEGPNTANGLPQYNFLFPDPKLIPASAPSLKANQQLSIPSEEPPWFPVDQDKGKETLWLVWSERPVPQMESMKKWLNTRFGGEIQNPDDSRGVQQFLNQYSNAATPVAEKTRTQTRLRGGKDGLLIYPLEVLHR